MRLASLVLLVQRDLRRSGGAFATAGFGILAGTAALVFFLSLGLAVRDVLLGDVFPLDRIELEPTAKPEPGLFALLMGSGKAPPGIPSEVVSRLEKTEGVVAVYPKLRFAFPSGAFGGKEIIGKDLGTHEMLADGVDPALCAADVKGPFPFVDPIVAGAKACKADADCGETQYCELPSGKDAGLCSEPVPVIVSPYLVELFNKGVAPAHNLPPVGMSLISRAQGVTFRLELGISMMGRSRKGSPRMVRARLVGVSRSAIDLGVTLPLPVVRRWNEEYFGPETSSQFSSVMVKTRSAEDVARVIAQGAIEGLEPKDTRARDVSVLVSGVLALLSLVAGTMLVVASSNIAYTFRVLIHERRTEIGLYRALGATPMDVGLWVTTLGAVVGLAGGVAGVVVARGAAFAADWVAAHKLPDFPFKPSSFFSFPLWLVLLGAGFGALFAVLGALSAARSAARLDPARALTEP